MVTRQRSRLKDSRSGSERLSGGRTAQRKGITRDAKVKVEDNLL
jgi:hypothetical protein